MTVFRGVLLAAGSSRRFGADKLLQPVGDGDCVGLQSARRLIAVVPDSIAVLRELDGPLADGLRRLGYRLVVNTDADAGIGGSIAVGIVPEGIACKPSVPPPDGWLIALADMPWIAHDSIAAVLRALQQGASIAAPFYRQCRGHPVGFGAHWRVALSGLYGDRGAAGIIAAQAGQVYRVGVNDPGILRDVDIPADLIRRPAQQRGRG